MGKMQIEVTVTGEQQRDHWTYTERMQETWEAEIYGQGDISRFNFYYEFVVYNWSILYIWNESSMHMYLKRVLKVSTISSFKKC